MWMTFIDLETRLTAFQGRWWTGGCGGHCSVWMDKIWLVTLIKAMLSC